MVKIALVGAGGIANRHAEAISKIDDASIVAVVDTVKEKAVRYLDTNPQSGLAAEIAGTAAVMQGDKNSAYQYLQLAAELAPDQSGPLTKLGSLLMQDGNIEQAEAQLLKAIAIHAEDRAAHQRLGLLYEYLNNFEASAKHLRIGVRELPPHIVGLRLNLARVLREDNVFTGDFFAGVAAFYSDTVFGSEVELCPGVFPGTGIFRLLNYNYFILVHLLGNSKGSR